MFLDGKEKSSEQNLIFLESNIYKLVCVPREGSERGRDGRTSYGREKGKDNISCWVQQQQLRS